MSLCSDLRRGLTFLDLAEDRPELVGPVLDRRYGHDADMEGRRGSMMRTVGRQVRCFSGGRLVCGTRGAKAVEAGFAGYKGGSEM